MQRLQVRAKHPGNFVACEIPERSVAESLDSFRMHIYLRLLQRA